MESLKYKVANLFVNCHMNDPDTEEKVKMECRQQHQIFPVKISPFYTSAKTSSKCLLPLSSNY